MGSTQQLNKDREKTCDNANRFISLVAGCSLYPNGERKSSPYRYFVRQPAGPSSIIDLVIESSVVYRPVMSCSGLLSFRPLPSSRRQDTDHRPESLAASSSISSSSSSPCQSALSNSRPRIIKVPNHPRREMPAKTPQAIASPFGWT